MNEFPFARPSTKKRLYAEAVSPVRRRGGAVGERLLSEQVMLGSRPREPRQVDLPQDKGLLVGRREAGDVGTVMLGSRPREPRQVGRPSQDESSLVRGLEAGDVGALTAIVRWLWEPLAAFAFRLVGDRDAARDIAQETCVRLWDGRARTPASLRPYLFRIARNLALDHVKTQRIRTRLLRRHGPDRARRTPPPDEVFERDRVTVWVQGAIQNLPERRREVFVLAYLQGLSYAEIGKVMGISPKTVQNQMTAALGELRTALRPLIEEAGPGRS